MNSIKGCNASFDTQSSSHPRKSSLLPRMSKLTMEGAGSKEKVKETGNAGRKTQRSETKIHNLLRMGMGEVEGWTRPQLYPAPLLAHSGKRKQEEEHAPMLFLPRDSFHLSPPGLSLSLRVIASPWLCLETR